jgi:hypothetical protein
MQLVCQPNLLNRHSLSQKGIDELSEILTVQKNEGRWLPILPQKRRASGGSEFHSPLPLTFGAHLNDEGFLAGRAMRLAAPRGGGGLWPNHTAIRPTFNGSAVRPI